MNPYTEALVVLQVHGESDGRRRCVIERELDDLPEGWVAESIESLRVAGAIELDGEVVYPSRLVKRLAALDLISF